MESVEVTARFDLQGKIIPVSFTWKERKYSVDSTGRRWDDKNGLHILVMVPIDRVFELVFDPEVGIWFLKRSGPYNIGI